MTDACLIVQLDIPAPRLADRALIVHARQLPATVAELRPGTLVTLRWADGLVHYGTVSHETAPGVDGERRWQVDVTHANAEALEH